MDDWTPVCWTFTPLKLNGTNLILNSHGHSTKKLCFPRVSSLTVTVNVLRMGVAEWLTGHQQGTKNLD